MTTDDEQANKLAIAAAFTAQKEAIDAVFAAQKEAEKEAARAATLRPSGATTQWVGGVEPQNPQAGDIWIDDNGNKIYLNSGTGWVTVNTPNANDPILDPTVLVSDLDSSLKTYVYNANNDESRLIMKFMALWNAENVSMDELEEIEDQLAEKLLVEKDPETGRWNWRPAVPDAFEADVSYRVHFGGADWPKPGVGKSDDSFTAPIKFNPAPLVTKAPTKPKRTVNKGRYLRSMNGFTTHSHRKDQERSEGPLVNPPIVHHTMKNCEDRDLCPFHHQSDHKMAHLPMQYRSDTGLIERICPHGVGHPDPDSVAFYLKHYGTDFGVHGCDGCC